MVPVFEVRGRAVDGGLGGLLNVTRREGVAREVRQKVLVNCEGLAKARVVDDMADASGESAVRDFRRAVSRDGDMEGGRSAPGAETAGQYCSQLVF